MNTMEVAIQIALLSVKQSQLRADYYKVRIESGVYKNRIVNHGSINGPLFSDEELLRDEIATMNRHIQNAEEKMDHVQQLLHKA